MNFLTDANLPRRLVKIFQERGHDTTQRLNYPIEMQQQILLFWIIPTKTTALSLQKIPILVHPSGYRTAQTNYYSSQQEIFATLSWKHFLSQILTGSL